MPTFAEGPVSGRDKAVEYLTERVLVDPAMQGKFLNEQDLALRIGVSRTPVREALLLLASDGLVEMIPKRGAQIPVITGRQIAELMELRAVLERHAATTAIENHRVPLAAMRDVLAHQEAMVATEPAESGREFIEWDTRFHQLLVDAAENSLISRSYAKLRARQGLVGVEALFRTHDRQGRVCAEHAEILDALAAGDAQASREAIDRHLEVTLDVLLRS
ncbi:GntR family transcriptional regulator [Pengzhenrongella sp.]|jgi:DNA-binding GntR family transcriptional regulator|uniref:GntR family transcriptional regulator n=1 Tax=Pengzhenrongella sp. TaxID=2888820 RepID=UPI002F95C3DC